MKYDIRFPARTYKVQGVDKTFWTTHGTLWVDDETKKMTIQLDSMPLNEKFTGKLWVYEQDKSAPKNQFGVGLTKDYDEDDAPF